MAVMARETWTDERLDDLVKTIDKGFEETKVEICDLRAETKAEFQVVRADVDKGFKEVKGEIKDLRTEMNANQRTMIIGFASIVASIVGSAVAGILATQL